VLGPRARNRQRRVPNPSRPDPAGCHGGRAGSSQHSQVPDLRWDLPVLRPIATLLLATEPTELAVTDAKADGEIFSSGTLTKRSPTAKFRFRCDELIKCRSVIGVHVDYQQMDLKVPEPIYIGP
jgi:hypothetical protein